MLLVVCVLTVVVVVAAVSVSQVLRVAANSGNLA